MKYLIKIEPPKAQRFLDGVLVLKIHTNDGWGTSQIDKRYLYPDQRELIYETDNPYAADSFMLDEVFWCVFGEWHKHGSDRTEKAVCKVEKIGSAVELRKESPC